MKNLKVAKTKLINGFGVALMKGEQIINHFDHTKHRKRDYHAEYLAENYTTYEEIEKFAKFYGGRIISKDRYILAKKKMKNKKPA